MIEEFYIGDKVRVIWVLRKQQKKLIDIIIGSERQQTLLTVGMVLPISEIDSAGHIIYIFGDGESDKVIFKKTQVVLHKRPFRNWLKNIFS